MRDFFEEILFVKATRNMKTNNQFTYPLAAKQPIGIG